MQTLDSLETVVSLETLASVELDSVETLDSVELLASLVTVAAVAVLTLASLVQVLDSLVLDSVVVQDHLVVVVQDHLAVVQDAACVHAFAAWLLVSAACSLVADAEHEALAATLAVAATK